MALVINAGDRLPPVGWQSVERIAQATATANRFIDPWTDVTFLGMGTASGITTNQYVLVATTTASGVEGDAVEGQEKYLLATATGRADVFILLPTQGRLPIAASMQSNFATIATSTASTGFAGLSASATGRWVFQAAGDFMRLKFMNGRWNYLDGAGATQHTTT